MKPRIHKYANGGAVHGAPMDRPKVGASTRKRPKVGDKDPNWVPPEKAKKPPKRIETPGKPGDSGPGGAHPGRNRKKKKRKKHTGSTFRDYRGTEGVIKDAGG